ncbi:MAG: hypothetical protein ACOCY7_04295, partial [Halodesulfurarchaeum sp.]
PRRRDMTEIDSYRREVTELVESGWRIESETDDRVTLVDRNFGTARNHLIIAVFTIWWLFGIPNVLYAAIKYLDESDRTIVWKRGSEEVKESGEKTTTIE